MRRTAESPVAARQSVGRDVGHAVDSRVEVQRAPAGLDPARFRKVDWTTGIGWPRETGACLLRQRQQGIKVDGPRDQEDLRPLPLTHWVITERPGN